MDPVTSLVSGHIAGKLIDRVADSFRVNVIERWSRRRASHFFQQFCFEVQRELGGERSEELEPLLDKLLEDEFATDLLFDSYRRISLSRSKSIGPRVIGILTARMAVENRHPTAAEESVLDAAEQLYDDEMLEFSSFIQDYQRRAADDNDEDVTLCERGILRIKWHCEQIDSNWDRQHDISLAPLNLSESCGSWGTKLAALGIIQTDMTERRWEYSEDSERHIDEDGSVREICWWIITWNTFFEFAALVDRVKFAATQQDTN